MFPRIAVAAVLLLTFGFARAEAQSRQPQEPQKYQPVGVEPVPPPDKDIFDVSLGFDYLHVDEAFAKNEYGGDFSLFANVTSWLALGGEFIAVYGEQDQAISRTRTVTFDEDRLFYVFGPRINVWQNDQFKIFVEAMGGGGHGHISALIFGLSRHASANGYAFLLGGGVEWKFNPHMALRMVEADYLPAHFNGQQENDFRVSTGISFFFGKGW